MLTTTNYGLKKPEGTDVVNIDDFNGNADIIDTKLKEINSALPLKAPLDSPGLTGAPTAPTQTPGDNSTKIANTAFVTIAIANKTSVSGNAGTATKLQTPRNIALAGDVTGSANFDGSGNISITTTVADDSHNHIIANVDGLQSALDVIDTHLSDLTNKKVDKTSIVNTATTTEAGFVLDARVAKYLKDYIDSLQVGTVNKPRQFAQNTDGKNIIDVGWNICHTNVNGPEADGEYYILVMNPYRMIQNPSGTLLRQIWFNLWNNKTYSRQCNVTNNWTWTGFAEL